MTPEVEIALIVALSSTSAPLLLSWLNGRQLRASKRADYVRQDAVAAQAAEAAKLLLAQNEKVAQTADETLGKLDVIHTLVNSSLTKAMQSELDATISQVALMKEIIELNKASNLIPATTFLAALKVAERRISVLQTSLDDRRIQTDQVAANEKKMSRP